MARVNTKVSCIDYEEMRQVYIQNNTPYKINSRYYANNIADACQIHFSGSLLSSPLEPLGLDGFEIPELHQQIVRNS